MPEQSQRKAYSTTILLATDPSACCDRAARSSSDARRRPEGGSSPVLTLSKGAMISMRKFPLAAIMTAPAQQRSTARMRPRRQPWIPVANTASTSLTKGEDQLDNSAFN
jgi:hypothetical protein